MRIDIDQWDGLIGELYDAVLEPDRLQGAIAHADRLLESDLCHIVGLSPLGEETFRLLSQPDVDDLGAQYASYYSRIDPRHALMARARVGETFRCAEFLDPSFVSKSEIYQDFLIPNGYRYVIGGCLHRGASSSVYVAFNHGAGRDDFNDEEKRFFGRYVRHLSRVMARLFAHAPVAAALASDSALQTLDYGVLALDRHGAIVYSNTLAEKLMRSLLQAQFDQGGLADGGELASLWRQLMLQGGAQARRLHSADGTAVFVSGMRSHPRADGATPFGQHLAGGSPAVVLVFSLGKHKAMAAPSQLIELFGLSPAEARLAHALGGGMAVNDYASLYNVSVATARTQLRAVLAKTGEARQQDLVRMLIALPRTGTPPPAPPALA